MKNIVYRNKLAYLWTRLRSRCVNFSLASHIKGNYLSICLNCREKCTIDALCVLWNQYREYSTFVYSSIANIRKWVNFCLVAPFLTKVAMGWIIELNIVLVMVWHIAITINRTITPQKRRYRDNIEFYYELHIRILFPHKYLFVFIVMSSTSHLIPYIF